MFFCGSVAQAAPWLATGDVRARFAVQTLADTGNNELLTTTWPLMWGDVASNTNLISRPAPSASMARAYLKFEQSQQAKAGLRGELSFQAQTQASAYGGFEANLSAEAATRVDVQWQGDIWALGLSPAYTYEPADDEEFRLDGSYLATAAGNWVLGAGAIDRWWGPGWRTSVMLSNNARPIEGVWLNRNISHAPDSPWLAWVGPWHFTLLAGENQAQQAMPRSKLVAARFTFRPLPRLELGLSSALADDDDDDSSAANSDKQREFSSLDFRYSQVLGASTGSVYAQAMEEHGADAGNPETLWLLGTGLTTTLLDADQQWYFEYTNVLANDYQNFVGLNRHTRVPGTIQNERTLVSSVNSNGKALTAGMYHFFNNGANLGAALTLVELNANDRQGHTRSPNNQNPAMVELSYGREVLGGWLSLKASVSDQDIEYLNGERDQYAARGSWTYRF